MPPIRSPELILALKETIDYISCLWLCSQAIEIYWIHRGLFASLEEAF